jgi:hypothetical protein
MSRVGQRLTEAEKGGKETGEFLKARKLAVVDIVIMLLTPNPKAIGTVVPFL